MTEPTGYPHALAGDPAGPPEPVDARVLGMAAKAHARHLAAVVEPLESILLPEAGRGYRRAYALDELVAEADAAAPHRRTTSDGWIGDTRHQEEGSGSDHNPWVTLAGQGIVRAEDLTNDPALGLPAAFERARAAAHAGRLPQLVNGGYLILAGRITAEDFSRWHVYLGADPHVSHGHVSVSLHPAGFDSRARWGLFSSEHRAPAGFTGPDLTGRGGALRGQAAGQPQGPQSNGPRVAALQTFLNRVYPAYAHLTVDGWYGLRTAAVLAEFARRSGIRGADGLNIGPQLAAALTAAGFEQTTAAPPPPARSAARARVLGHLARGDRR